MSKPVNHLSKFTMAACGGVGKEDFGRDENNPNLDPEKTKDNYVIQIKEKDDGKLYYSNTHEKLSLKKLAQQRIDKLTLPKAVRKDAVVCASFVVSADKEFFDNLNQKEKKLYFNRAVNFYANKFGNENVLYGSVHLDEATPHMHLRLSPVTKDGRLCAKEVFDRNALQMIQREFSAYMRDGGFNLEDVEHGNKRKHRSEIEQRVFAVEQREKTVENSERAILNLCDKVDNLYADAKKLTEKSQILYDNIQKTHEEILGHKSNALEKSLGAELSHKRTTIDQKLAEVEKVRNMTQIKPKLSPKNMGPR